MRVQMDRPHAKYVNDKPIVEMGTVPREGEAVILGDGDDEQVWTVSSVTWLIGYMLSGEDWLPHVRLHLIPEDWGLDEADDYPGTIQRLWQLWRERR